VRYALASLFQYGFSRFADRIAIADGSTHYSFQELEIGAQRIAALLHAKGVGCNDRVVVLADKRSLIPMLAVAIWKVGAVYCPIDGHDRSLRNRRIVDVLEPAAILEACTSPTAMEEGRPAITLDELERCAVEPCATRFTETVKIDESSPAYILFTSGSTGDPKGVVISHTSLLDYFYNHNQVFCFTDRSRALSFAPFHFDVSFECTFLPLSVGAFTYQFRGIPIAAMVQSLLERERISHMIAVSTLLTLISRDNARISPDYLPSLQMVMTGAEVCDPKVINLWKQRMPDTRVVNAYGPTEVTIVCLTHTIEQPQPGREHAYPIGRPLDGVVIKLMGEAGEIIQPGESGELWVGGSQVMLGYFNNAEATAASIRICDGVRYYLTGDICRFDETGALEFVGRVDDEVKLAGRRLNLGEVRQIAMSQHNVTRTAAGVVELQGSRHIALIIISDSGASVMESVRMHLLANLPAHMQPRVLAIAETPHLSSTGKTAELQLINLLKDACSRYGADRYLLAPGAGFIPMAEHAR
jgi:amino acid adenylation domain-containing protein